MTEKSNAEKSDTRAGNGGKITQIINADAENGGEIMTTILPGHWAGRARVRIGEAVDSEKQEDGADDKNASSSVLTPAAYCSICNGPFCLMASKSQNPNNHGDAASIFSFTNRLK